MGTSISYRSPNVARWRVFQQALAAQTQDQLPLERLRSEFFLAAAADWEEALSAPGVAAFAGAICDAWATMPERFAAADTPERAIAVQVDAARQASLPGGFTPASALAERAFQLTLMRAMGAEGPVAETSPRDAAAGFERGRGSSPSDLVQRYAGELVAQLARHVAARDSVALVAPDRLGGRTARTVTRDLAALAAQSARHVPVEGVTNSDVRDEWSATVAHVFARGQERAGQ